MEIPKMVFDLVDKEVKVYTMDGYSVKGKLVQVENEWLKVVQKNGKECFVSAFSLMKIAAV